jgi:hypothetical protein
MNLTIRPHSKKIDYPSPVTFAIYDGPVSKPKEFGKSIGAGNGQMLD